MYEPEDIDMNKKMFFTKEMVVKLAKANITMEEDIEKMNNLIPLYKHYI
jgi:hypothetical protein